MTSRCSNPSCARLYVKTRHDRQTYCSRQCSWTAKTAPRVVVECPVCHAMFSKKAHAVQVFCGYECRDVQRGREHGAHLIRCESCHSLYDKPHECPGDRRETYGYSMLALAEAWS